MSTVDVSCLLLVHINRGSASFSPIALATYPHQHPMIVGGFLACMGRSVWWSWFREDLGATHVLESKAFVAYWEMEEDELCGMGSS
jgi:hypothetical protein